MTTFGPNDLQPIINGRQYKWDKLEAAAAEEESIWDLRANSIYSKPNVRCTETQYQQLRPAFVLATNLLIRYLSLLCPAFSDLQNSSLAQILCTLNDFNSNLGAIPGLSIVKEILINCMTPICFTDHDLPYPRLYAYSAATYTQSRGFHAQNEHPSLMYISKHLMNMICEDWDMHTGPSDRKLLCSFLFAVTLLHQMDMTFRRARIFTKSSLSLQFPMLVDTVRPDVEQTLFGGQIEPIQHRDDRGHLDFMHAIGIRTMANPQKVMEMSPYFILGLFKKSTWIDPNIITLNPPLLPILKDFAISTANRSTYFELKRAKMQSDYQLLSLDFNSMVAVACRARDRQREELDERSADDEESNGIPDAF